MQGCHKVGARCLLYALLLYNAAMSHKFYHGTARPFFPHSDLPFAVPPVDRSIMIFDDALTSEECRLMIDHFESSPSDHFDGAVIVKGAVTVDATYKKNTELWITELAQKGSTRWISADSLLATMVQKHLGLYQDANAIISTQQNPFSDEGFRLKRYNSGGDEHHAYHADSGGETACKPHRILAVLLYLNDVEEGGETVFLNQGFSITPVCGRLAIFPTAFSFVHAGKRPRSGTKFCVINFLTT